ncbi:pre-mRNA-splicing helicase BRR2 [Apostasia shenzhenica]|uniref:Pre-mRNA-splicing helicase BRR2 n=1 Tax=Apostasia shenzhenica TaxID=1088818 RepID=A0A2H9ZWZ5_9ASPA|nr:pre-mRNA-splicing helicase BRR2 [Apostasia shenzhenica]
MSCRRLVVQGGLSMIYGKGIILTGHSELMYFSLMNQQLPTRASLFQNLWIKFMLRLFLGQFRMHERCAPGMVILIFIFVCSRTRHFTRELFIFFELYLRQS